MTKTLNYPVRMMLRLSEDTLDFYVELGKQMNITTTQAIRTVLEHNASGQPIKGVKK